MQLGGRVNGIHEVMGSIPISSTNSSYDLAAHDSRARLAVTGGLFFRQTAVESPVTCWNEPVPPEHSPL